MSKPHPDLCLRPRVPIGRNRPTLTHPILGTLELVNRDGVWWQGTANIAGVNVRLDVQEGANPKPAALDDAGQLLQWVQTNEPAIRAAIRAALAAGNVGRVGLRVTTVLPPLEDATFVDQLRPHMLVLWSNCEADFKYVCDDLPEGHLLGCHQVKLRLDTHMKIKPVFRELDLANRAEHILERTVPTDAADFVDSIADQFIAKTAAWGSIQFDSELTDLITEAIRDVETRIEHGSPECAAYMTSVLRVLQTLADKASLRAAVPADVVEILSVHNRLAFVHPAGKRVPIKAKLKLLDENFRYDGTLMSVWFPPTIIREPIDELQTEFEDDIADEPVPEVSFEETFPKSVQGITKWLDAQEPSAFDDFRQAGFTTELIFNVSAKPTPTSIDLDLPADLLSACGRLGITVTTRVAPHDW